MRTKRPRTLAALAVAATALTLPSPVLSQAGGHEGHRSPPARDYEAVWDEATRSERKAATTLVERTREAAVRWEDVDAALTDGYVARHGGVGAVHYPNFANRRDDGVLDPERPESLVYLQRPNGDPILLGVVYIATPREERPTPAGEIAAWHVHGVAGCHHPDIDAGCSDVRGGMLHVFLYDGVLDPFADPMFASMGTREAWRSKLLDLAGYPRADDAPSTRQATR
jgi:hypothetical protein